MIQPSGSETFKQWMTVIQFNNKKVVRFADNNRYDEMTLGQIKRYGENAPNYVSYFNNEFDYKLWIPSFYYNNNKQLFSKESIQYLGEAIYIPALLGRLRLSQWNKNLENVNIKSNMDIVTYSDKPILLMSSNKFLEDIDFTKSVLTAEPSANFNLNSNDIFSGHPLEITYYEFAKKLFMTINEVRRNNPFNYLFKLKLNY